jgi:hypothetical protein
MEHIDDESLVYVGHTTNFSKRKGEHKSNCKNENGKAFNYKLYEMIRSNGGWNSFKMIEIEKHPCNDKHGAGRREDEVMKDLKANMNSHKASRTQKQYYEANKDKLKEKNKEYCEGNKDYCKEYNKEYREIN